MLCVDRLDHLLLLPHHYFHIHYYWVIGYYGAQQPYLYEVAAQFLYISGTHIIHNCCEPPEDSGTDTVLNDKTMHLMISLILFVV